jgi:hypothetical protein
MTPTWLTHPVTLTALAALVPIAGLLWALWHLRHEHCRQIVEHEDLIRDLIDVVDPPEPRDLFTKPGLPERLIRFRAEHDQAEQQELAR